MTLSLCLLLEEVYVCFQSGRTCRSTCKRTADLLKLLRLRNWCFRQKAKDNGRFKKILPTFCCLHLDCDIQMEMLDRAKLNKKMFWTDVSGKFSRRSHMEELLGGSKFSCLGTSCLILIHNLSIQWGKGNPWGVRASLRADFPAQSWISITTCTTTLIRRNLTFQTQSDFLAQSPLLHLLP